MSKRNIVIAVVVVLVVGLGFWINKVNKNMGYSVVYMTTGEVYAGKLSAFPDFQLKDAYILTTVPDETDPKKSNFKLNPISEALWATESMHLTRKNVVFYAALLPTSKIAEAIAGKVK